MSHPDDGTLEPGGYVARCPRGHRFVISPKLTHLGWRFRGFGFARAAPFIGGGIGMLIFAAYAEITRKPSEPSLVLPFAIFAAVGFFFATVQLLQFDTVEITESVSKWTQRGIFRSRRAEVPIDEVRLVRCRVLIGRSPRPRHGLAIVSGGACVPIAIAKDERVIAKYKATLPEQLRKREAGGLHALWVTGSIFA